MAHRYQTHHLRTIAMNYMLKQARLAVLILSFQLLNYLSFLFQRDHVMRTEGFRELSPELLQEFKQNGKSKIYKINVLKFLVSFMCIVACAKKCSVTGVGAHSSYEGETAFFKIEVPLLLT